MISRYRGSRRESTTSDDKGQACRSDTRCEIGSMAMWLVMRQLQLARSTPRCSSRNAVSDQTSFGRNSEKCGSRKSAVVGFGPTYSGFLVRIRCPHWRHPGCCKLTAKETDTHLQYFFCSTPRFTRKNTLVTGNTFLQRTI